MSHVASSIPFIFQNSTNFEPTEFWFGHYTSKDKDAKVSPTMFYRGKSVGPGEVVQLGSIYIVTNSKDYWSIFYRYKGMLFGAPNTWYECEASSDYNAVRIALTGSLQAQLLCPSGSNGWNPFSNGKFAIDDLMLNPDYEKKK
jgi:hypothetical protein